MNRHTTDEQIAFRYRTLDSSTGVTRQTGVRQIKKLVPQDKKRSAHSSLFEVKTA